MEKKKILYISQEITPYLPETEMSEISRYLPQGVQEKGREIRTFMPRYGSVNERRNQLHEVIRLSGMNLVINDTDHPLIIKVASIQTARMQVYFIDNEDYFHRKHVFANSLSLIHIFIFSTHIIEDISSSCNQVAVINRGDLKYFGTPNDMVRMGDGFVLSLIHIYPRESGEAD